jgi:hypothetical protein
MSYWNKNNFEGMRFVGERYAQTENFELFGKYCLQKEQGLKKQAIASINAFVANLREKPVGRQREIAVELSALSFYNPKIHQLIAHPLREYIHSVLVGWVSDEPLDPTPHKWLGHMARDVSSYERALALDPEDEVCLGQVAEACLRHIDYQTHHLSESLFIGELSDAKSSLHKAQILVTKLEEGELRQNLQHDLDYYSTLLRCWEEYSTSNAPEGFPEWCVSRGYRFDLGTIVYYNQPVSAD